jgi:hypothetical protein
MFNFIIFAIVVGGILLIVKNIFDRPAAQYLKNKDNEGQREHEHCMEELKMKNWKDKHQIESERAKNSPLDVEKK